jgi:hypothetical protein
MSYVGLKWSHGVLWTLTVEAWGLTMELCRVCMPVVADFHQFDEEQDPDPHNFERSDHLGVILEHWMVQFWGKVSGRIRIRIHIKLKGRIRIHIKVKGLIRFRMWL